MFKQREGEFKLNDSGVWFIEEYNDEHHFICSPLVVTAITRDKNGQNFGHLLEWKDIDDVKHQWVMPMRLLAGDGLDLYGELLDGGFPPFTNFSEGSNNSAPTRDERLEILMDYIALADNATFFYVERGMEDELRLVVSDPEIG